jgi:hypothetical protein
MQGGHVCHAHREGPRKHNILFLAAYFAKPNMKFCRGKAGAAKNFFFPTPVPYFALELLEFKSRYSDFHKRMFEFRSRTTAERMAL